MANIKTPFDENYCSEDISKLVESLLEFDELVTEIQYDKTGFKKNKYVTLGKLVSTIKGPLKKCGIRVIQIKSSRDNKIYLNTVLYHVSSKQWIKSVVYFADEKERTPQEMQDFGACSTYAKRYEIGQILNIVGTDDDLDDMPIQDKQKKYEPHITTNTYKPVPPKINNKRNELMQLIENNKELEGDLCFMMRVTDPSKITDDKLDTAIFAINKLKDM